MVEDTNGNVAPAVDVFNGFGVKVTLPDKDSFLKCRETLERIGVAAKKEKILYQSCHILHKRGEYSIVHFKEMFALDGKPSSITENDYARRNRIAILLEEWGLVNIVDKKTIETNVAPLSQIKIISYKEKQEWTRVAKYNIGKKKDANVNNE